MPTLGSKGTNQPLLIRQGADWSCDFILLNPIVAPATVAVPLDLTGCTIRGQIRKTAKSSDITATFVVAYTVTPTDGKFNLSLSNAVTALIAAGVDESDAKSLYVWDLELLDTLGRITPIFYGDVKVFREVTR
jgi:hypothetical protein